MKDKTNQKEFIENNTSQSPLLNRRKLLAALGTTGLAFIAGRSNAGPGKPRNGKFNETRIYESVDAMKTDNDINQRFKTLVIYVHNTVRTILPYFT